jgi:Aspartyl protease
MRPWLDGPGRFDNWTCWPKRLFRFAFAAVALIATQAPAAIAAQTHAAPPACRVDTVASVPVETVGREPIVTLMLNDQAAHFILDTGAERTVVSEAAAQRLGLARDSWVGTTMSGIGGIQTRPDALPRSISLAGVPLVRNTLAHDTSLVVTPDLRGQAPGQIDGLLGRDYLSRYDLDLDLPHQRIGLETVQGCAGRFLPWQLPYVGLKPLLPMTTGIVLPVLLDGHALRALLDSGASSSLLAAPGMFRLGLNVAQTQSDASQTVSGVGPHAVIMRRHRFATLSVAGPPTQQPEIWVAPAHLIPIVDMLLGMDWLMTQHVWISYATDQVFIQTPQ